MSKKGKLRELSYTIEALEDEVEHLKEVAALKQSRIAELITENDRLTLAYEPYTPPKVKKSLRERLFPPARFAGDLAFDYWPPSDWVRFSVKKWRPGQYYQACVGPLRFEFYAN